MRPPRALRRAAAVTLPVTGAAAIVAALLFGGGQGGGVVVSAGASLPPPPPCSATAQYPTSSPRYGLPISNLIVGGSLSQGSTTIANINATVCGLLQFPSLSADIPASQIVYDNSGSGRAKITLSLSGTLPPPLGGLLGKGGGTTTGYAIIHASGPSTAITSDAPAPNGGLIFTLTAETYSTLVLEKAGLVIAECNIGLDATLNTDPSEGGTALVGPLTGAQGTAYANSSHVTVSSLTPASAQYATQCAALNSVLKPHTTPATFKAPIDFYSTLTSF